MFGIVIFMGVVMAYNTFLRFYPFKTVVVNSIKILTPEIERGGTVRYMSDYCRYTDSQTVVYKTVVDVNDLSKRYPLPSTDRLSVPGCHVREGFTNIDPQVPPGEYYIEATSVDKIEDREIKVKTIIGNFKIK